MRFAFAVALAVTACESQGSKPLVAPPLPPVLQAKPAVTDITAQDYVMAPMPHARVTLVDAYGGKHPVDAEVAWNRDQRTRGLMWRTELAEGKGMLFIFPGDTWLSFWMKNTLIPLEILYFDAEGYFVNSLTMEPCKEVPCPGYPSASLAKFALEVNPGFREQHEITLGWKLDPASIKQFTK